MSEGDDFVEDLLSKLHKPEALSEFERKRFEKLIDSTVAEMHPSSSKRNFRLPLSVAAGITLILGVGIIASNKSSVTPVAPTSEASAPKAVSSSPSTVGKTSTTTSSPTKAVNTPPTTSNGSTGGQVYGNSNSDVENGEVPLFETNLDYRTDLAKIHSIITLAKVPANPKSLLNTDFQCAVSLGISNELLAFDKGYLDGQRVSAFYFLENSGLKSVQLVDSSCLPVTKLNY